MYISDDYTTKKKNNTGDRSLATDEGEIETYTYNVYGQKLKKNYDETIDNSGHSGKYVGKEYDRKNKLNTNKLIFDDKSINNDVFMNNKNGKNNKFIDDAYIENNHDKYTKYGENDEDKYIKKQDFNKMYDKPYQYSRQYSSKDMNDKAYGENLNHKKNNKYNKYNDIFNDVNIKNKKNTKYNKGRLIDVKNEGYNKESVYDGDYNQRNQKHDINNKLLFVQNAESFRNVTGGEEKTAGGEVWKNDAYNNNENQKYGKYDEMDTKKYNNGMKYGKKYDYDDKYKRYENDDKLWANKYQKRHLLVLDNQLMEMNGQIWNIYFKFGIGFGIFAFELIYMVWYLKN